MSTGCFQSPGRDTARMLPLAAKTGLGTGDCDWRGLDQSWLGSGGFRRRPGLPRCEVSPPAAGCFRYLAARPTSAARLACSPPSPRPASRRRVERARGGADWARAEPNFASNGCDDAFNSVRARAAHLLARGPCQTSMHRSAFTPISCLGLRLCKEDRTNIGSWRLFRDRREEFEKEVEALLKTEEGWMGWLGVTGLGR